MSLKLSHATADDARSLGETHPLAFSRTPTYAVTYRNVPPEAMVSKHQRAFAKEISEQDRPTPVHEKHVLKVTDDDDGASGGGDGKIVAYGVWIYLPQGYSEYDDPQAQMGELPDGVDEALAMEFAFATGKVRGEHEGRRREGHWMLSLLGTHPDHRGRGAAGLIIRWPFERADQQGVECYVDASDLGYPVYRKCGFLEDVGEATVDLERYEGGQGYGVQRWVAMLRKPNRSRVGEMVVVGS